jgi:citrate lyase subunit beta / citryl-CoA lyase
MAAASPWRTLLFAPGDDERKAHKALGAATDAVILDLEDAVLPDRKAAARAVIAGLDLSAVEPAVLVRINGLDTPDAADDLALVRARGDLAAVLVPKAEPDTLAALDLGGLPPLVALVETATGVLGAAAVAATPGVVQLMLGTVDLSTELGIDVTPEGQELLHARSALVLASAAAGLPAPIDGVWPRPDDERGLVVESRTARRLGFGAKACIHPRQLDAVELAFAPSATEVAWAEKVVAAAAEGAEAGQGVVAHEGQMIDRPVLLRAEAILAARR